MEPTHVARTAVAAAAARTKPSGGKGKAKAKGKGNNGKGKGKLVKDSVYNFEVDDRAEADDGCVWVGRGDATWDSICYVGCNGRRVYILVRTCGTDGGRWRPTRPPAKLLTEASCH